MEPANSEFSRVKTTEDSVDPGNDFSLLMRTCESFLQAYDLSDLSTKWRLSGQLFSGMALTKPEEKDTGDLASL